MPPKALQLRMGKKKIPLGNARAFARVAVATVRPGKHGTRPWLIKQALGGEENRNCPSEPHSGTFSCSLPVLIKPSFMGHGGSRKAAVMIPLLEPKGGRGEALSDSSVL